MLNPFFILSGFMFPISSMPQVLKWFTYINPLRYYLVVIRGTFLKGVGDRAQHFAAITKNDAKFL